MIRKRRGSKRNVSKRKKRNSSRKIGGVENDDEIINQTQTGKMRRGSLISVGGPLVRSATDNLKEARTIRESIGHYAPNEEAHQRGKKKFYRAMAKLKGMNAAANMLRASHIKNARSSRKKVVRKQTMLNFKSKREESDARKRRRNKRRNLAEKKVKKAAKRAGRLAAAFRGPSESEDFDPDGDGIYIDTDGDGQYDDAL